MAVRYKELSALYEFVRSMKKATGRRVFQRNDSTGTIAPADLPIVGLSQMVNESGNVITGCVALKSRMTYAGGHGESALYTVDYGPPGLEGSVEHEDTTVRFDIGIQQLSSPAHFWKYRGSTTPVSTPIPIEISVGTITRIKSGLSESQNTAFRNTLVQSMGTLNVRSFEGFARGNVKFEGAYGGSYRDSNGDVKFSYELVFTYRIARTLGAGSQINDIWQKEYNAEGGVWLEVIDSTNSKQRYSYMNFENLVD